MTLYHQELHNLLSIAIQQQAATICLSVPNKYYLSVNEITQQREIVLTMQDLTKYIELMTDKAFVATYAQFTYIYHDYRVRCTFNGEYELAMVIKKDVLAVPKQNLPFHNFLYSQVKSQQYKYTSNP